MADAGTQPFPFFLGKLRPVNRAKRLNYVLFFALSSFICNFAT